MNDPANDLTPLLQRALQDLLAVPGVRALVARHLRLIADSLDEPDAPTAQSNGSLDWLALDDLMLSGDGPGRDDAAPPSDPTLPPDALGTASPATSTSAPSDAPEIGNGASEFDPEQLRLLIEKDWGPAAPPSPLPELPGANVLTHGRPAANLNLLGKRFSLKADACETLAQGAQVPETTRTSALLMQTRLWMKDYADARPEWLMHLAACYRATALAAALLDLTDFTHDEARRRDVVDATSHASSLVVGSILRLRDDGDLNADPDARDLHLWLRHLTEKHAVYQDRYLSLSTMAPLHSVDACTARLESLIAGPSRQQTQEEALKALRYHVRKLISNAEHAFHGDHERERVVAKTGEAERVGLAASSRRLRDTLLPAYDLLPRPADAPPFYEEVLRYLDEDVERERSDVDEEMAAEEPLSENVAAARALLEGRSVYLLGGVPRPDAARRVQEALGLRELVWPETRAHQSVEPLRATIHRADVAVLVQLIRYSSHNVGELREECLAAGKPFVRLRGGYGVEALARAILNQASEQLAR